MKEQIGVVKGREVVDGIRGMERTFLRGEVMHAIICAGRHVGCGRVEEIDLMSVERECDKALSRCWYDWKCGLSRCCCCCCEEEFRGSGKGCQDASLFISTVGGLC